VDSPLLGYDTGVSGDSWILMFWRHYFLPQCQDLITLWGRAISLNSRILFPVYCSQCYCCYWR